MSLLALVLVLGATPAFAASSVLPGEENPAPSSAALAQDVQAQLATLQNAYIQPEWLPDIEANESAVQALLDTYAALTLDERAQLSGQDNTVLRSYFTALYQVQGKDDADVDTLFTESSAPDYEPPAQPAPVSISSAPSSAPPPVSSSAPQSQPVSSQSVAPPAPVGGDSWGSRTLGTGVLLVLAAVAVILFARFLFALRKAKRSASSKEAGTDIRAQELFGENYDPVENPVDKDFLPSLPQVEDTAVPPTAPAIILRKTPEPARSFAMFAPENAPDGKKEKKSRPDKKGGSEEANLPPPRVHSPFEGSAGTSRFDKAFGSTGPLAGAVAAPPAVPGVETKTETTPPDAPPEDPPFGANPDRRNAITTRSFSAPPRTGRTGKMTFRQGDPEDMDAIDE